MKNPELDWKRNELISLVACSVFDFDAARRIVESFETAARRDELKRRAPSVGLPKT